MEVSMRNQQIVKKRILESAKDFFETRGFDNTTTIDIISSLEIREEEFFYHYSSLDEVLDILWSE